MESGKAWEHVGRRFSELSKTLGEGYRRRAEESGRGAGEPGLDEASSVPSGQKLGHAFQQAIDQLDKVFNSLGETLRDPEAKKQMREAANSLGDALETTFTEVGGEIRKAIGSSKRPRSEGGTA
jgi:hypothetical protein